MDNVLISSPVGVMFMLVFVAAFWFWVEQVTSWKFFNLVPPLLFIYATPVILNNTGVIPSDSPVYGGMRDYVLPVFIVLMLLKVNVPAAIRVMGKGVLVMLMGTAGVVLGAPVAYAVVSRWLSPDAWKGFGALAGSWIGGTGNMAAAAAALDTPGDIFGLAVLADNVVYIVWLPILLGSKSFADRFNKWARVHPDRIKQMDDAAASLDLGERTIVMRDYLYLVALALVVTWLSNVIGPMLPELSLGAENPVITTSVWKLLLVTTMALSLSVTPARRLPGSTTIATAIIYVFVAAMGARASIEGLGQAPAFLLGAFIWIFIHGAFCLLGAWLFRVDVHSVAIASAANIGGAASAPIVAAYHRPSLVPVSILMALIGYAMGNFLAILAGELAHWAGGGG